MNYYLNPNDYTKKIDGSAADITTGADGDVMVEFPVVYWMLKRLEPIYMLDTQTNLLLVLNHLLIHRGTILKDKCYVSAYLGYNLSSKLRSLSGKVPYAGGIAPAGTIGTCRTLAQRQWCRL